ncbi:MAG: plasmid-related protein [Methylibium sp.]|jgi:hypothetical protein|uniref:plasmid-related protein n=1 Tax=Roseateles sp. TaxID=1971397 RepID=UPI0037C74EFF|nr:plasmid-related protein [Methylibium sp.]
MSTKDAGMRIRVETELREAFVQACQRQGFAAAEVLRDFMRQYAAKHALTQSSLFDVSALEGAMRRR